MRRSCQTMALWIGLPVARSQTSAVSRWLVMPMAAIGAGFGAGRCSASRAVASVVRPEVLGVVLDPAGLRVVLGELALRDGQHGAARRRRRSRGWRWCPGRWPAACRSLAWPLSSAEPRMNRVERGDPLGADAQPELVRRHSDVVRCARPFVPHR